MCLRACLLCDGHDALVLGADVGRPILAGRSWAQETAAARRPKPGERIG